MFTVFLLSICCFSLALSSSIDQKSNENLPDGNQYTIKSVGVTYAQHVTNNGQCTVELNDQDDKLNQLTEGEIIQIKGKWFKVEDCRLNRAYIASCGSKLFYQMRKIVCSYVEQHHEKAILQRRETIDGLIDILDRSYYAVCCKSACTISEFARHCSSKW